MFRIDFRTFMPSGPPAGGKTYWVVLEPMDASGQPGMKSMPVQVTYASQLGANIAAFAGREDDMVAQTQMALSKTSKLSFLQELVAKSVELLGESSDALGAAAATGNIPDAAVRMTPRKPISIDVEADALPKLGGTNVPLPHYLRFLRIVDMTDMTSSPRAEFPRSGVVAMYFSLAPDQLYLLDVRIESAGRGLELDSPGLGGMAKHRCQIDALLQKKVFSVPAGPAQLLAVIKRSDSLSAYDNCGFTLQESPPAPADGSWTPRWTFFSVELTRLFNQ
ncbi:MAG: hypothetical protein P8Y15_11545 [Gemmatimonadales bacterium]